MKILSLNTWGSCVRPGLYEFVSRHAADTDVFCFQEVFDAATSASGDFLGGADLEGFDRLSEILPDHTGYFCPSKGEHYGIAVFVRSGLDSGDARSRFLCQEADWDGTGASPSRALAVRVAGVDIVAVHGTWIAETGKRDTPERLLQSDRLIEMVADDAGAFVLIGDFNLRPDTESVARLEAVSRNLVREYAIPSTRTELYGKPDPYADYAFVGPAVSVRDFRVLPEPVSDHAALVLEIG